MKLGKLLAAGKSIMNGHTEISYRSSKQIYLPKFGSAKNPFKSEASTQAAEVTPVVETAHLASGTAIAASDTSSIATDQHAPTVATEPRASASSSAANVEPSLVSVARDQPRGLKQPQSHNMGSVAAQPAAKLKSNPQSPARNPRSDNASTLQRFNALVRSALGKARFSDMSAKNQKGTATQTELSLDSVKVVHNDLSDVDVEVVPIKSRSGAPELPAPKKSWEYVGERLFGVEAT